MVNLRKKTYIFVFCLAILVLVFFIYRTLEARKIGSLSKQKLPNISLETMKGQRKLLHDVVKKSEFTVIVLFESRCGNCRTFISELINENLEIGGGSLLLLTHETLNSVDKDYVSELLKLPNSQFYFVDPKIFLANFGSIKVPQLLVYNPNLTFSEKLSKVLFFKEKFYVEK